MVIIAVVDHRVQVRGHEGGKSSQYTMKARNVKLSSLSEKKSFPENEWFVIKFSVFGGSRDLAKKLPIGG